MITSAKNAILLYSNAIRSLGFRPILGDFISETDVVRHDSTKLGQAILRLAR